MVGIDHERRAFGQHLRQLGGDRLHRAGVEEDVAQEDQVVLAAARALEEALSEVREGFAGHALDLHQADLAPAPHLALEAVELAGGRENPHRSVALDRGHDALHELVRVRREGQGLGVGEA